MVKSFRQFITNLQLDIDRYVFVGKYPWYITLIGTQGLWVMTQYRFARWVKFHLQIPVIRQIFRLFCAIWEKLNEILTNCEFPNTAEIGEGIYMPHAFGITIHCDAKIGKNCNIGQHVTIGWGGRSDKSGIPIIGDRVFIAPGACIFGPIKIGNDVAIGSNAVVTKDLPDNAVAVGIPAKIISYKGSQDFISYRSKELASKNI